MCLKITLGSEFQPTIKFKSRIVQEKTELYWTPSSRLQQRTPPSYFSIQQKNIYLNIFGFKVLLSEYQCNFFTRGFILENTCSCDCGQCAHKGHGQTKILELKKIISIAWFGFITQKKIQYASKWILEVLSLKLFPQKILRREYS